MRSPEEIQARLSTESETYNKLLLLDKALDGNLEQLAFLIGETYEKAFLNALRHRPNGELVDKFATLTWLAGSDINITNVAWLQYGMPRIRRMAFELKLPFVPLGSDFTKLQAKRMSNGQPCTPRCLRCFRGTIR